MHAADEKNELLLVIFSMLSIHWFFMVSKCS